MNLPKTTPAVTVFALVFALLAAIPAWAADIYVSQIEDAFGSPFYAGATALKP